MTPLPVVVVDYGVGNTRSIVVALERAGASAEVTSDAARIANATRIVLPGVGAFDAAMARLDDTGLGAVLDDRRRHAGVRVLGICLGMQLMTRSSEEGARRGLGWLAGSTCRIAPFESTELRLPHIGWGEVHARSGEALFAGVPNPTAFYFAHSFVVECDDASEVIAQAEYGRPFAAAVRRGNLWGIQFHAERSHIAGLSLLRNFLVADA